ncbi:hypothetical protein Cgig2_015433 [Carnegiea gigantea]|uniref:Uncharacterized protein n=1 Tax=Carnegiea gigantea TaxID=171969 RepID=A0A9Q1JXV3_9CARY|nr:hypothetical protein Cgig2_015433 [Carnegiea gigantea]
MYPSAKVLHSIRSKRNPRGLSTLSKEALEKEPLRQPSLLERPKWKFDSPTKCKRMLGRLKPIKTSIRFKNTSKYLNIMNITITPPLNELKLMMEPIVAFRIVDMHPLQVPHNDPKTIKVNVLVVDAPMAAYIILMQFELDYRKVRRLYKDHKMIREFYYVSLKSVSEEDKTCQVEPS